MVWAGVYAAIFAHPPFGAVAQTLHAHTLQGAVIQARVHRAVLASPPQVAVALPPSADAVVGAHVWTVLLFASLPFPSLVAVACPHFAPAIAIAIVLARLVKLAKVPRKSCDTLASVVFQLFPSTRVRIRAGKHTLPQIPAVRPTHSHFTRQAFVRRFAGTFSSFLIALAVPHAVAWAPGSPTIISSVTGVLPTVTYPFHAVAVTAAVHRAGVDVACQSSPPQAAVAHTIDTVSVPVAFCGSHTRAVGGGAVLSFEPTEAGALRGLLVAVPVS